MPAARCWKNEIVSPVRPGYSDGVLWRKIWRPEMVMTLAGGILMAFFTGMLTAELLRRAGVTGFRSPDDAGSVLVATLSLHGSVLVAGFLFLKHHGIGWREVAGLDTTRWQRQLALAAGALLAALPVMFALKMLSEMLLRALGWPLEDQRAVELILNCKSTGLKLYLGIFAVVIAPAAEEFLFRGLIFSGFKKAGWPVSGWLVTSLLFALIHGSAPVFLPLFAFALALTWLYEKTDGLLAPVLAHSAFNAANLALLVIAQKLELVAK
jgi:membrane protease YdiL (CAAX protease family)